MKTIFYFESRKWLSSRAVWITFIAWCMIVTFSVQQRGSAIQVTISSNDTAIQYEAKKAAEYYTLLDSVETGKKQVTEWAADPRNPVVFNRTRPIFALFETGPLDIFATGQDDVLSQHYLVSSRYDYRIQKQDAANGLQLLYGKLDVAFVIVFLLPLIIIAFNYNTLSGEKENNTLKLLLAQNASLGNIIWAKTLVSFLFTFLLLLVPLVIIGIAGINNTGISAAFFYLATVLLYALFWHLACVLVNTKLKSSAYNAAVLLSSWLLIALVIPALVNVITGIVHPVPSRTRFVTDYRHTLNEIERDTQSIVLDKYFFDHPELGKPDTSGSLRNRANEFFKAAHINQDKTQTSLQPLYAAHFKSLWRANDLADKAGRISPAVCLQQSLTLLAGQSSRQYIHFNEQIDAWRKPYLDFILKKLVSDEAVSKAEVQQFNKFYHKPYEYNKLLGQNLGVLNIFNMVLLSGILLSLRRRSYDR